MSVRYIPRNDFVLYRIVNRGETRGIAMPDIASQGKDTVVVAVGPKVTDLKPGMKVKVIGMVGEDVISLPEDRDLLVTKEANVILIVKGEENV